MSVSAVSRSLSIRCDQHPPMSASMYCAHCKTFLCRICAEIKPGGRFCAACKRLCLPSTHEELMALHESRIKLKQEAAGAKTAADKVKLEREAKLKAEFAAKKIEWAQKQAAATALAQQAPATIVIKTSAAAAPSTVGILDIQKDSALRKALKNPDELAKLGERSYLNVIGKARNYMLLIGVLTLLVNGGLMWWIAEQETRLDSQIEAGRQELIAHFSAEIKVAKSAEQRKELEAQRAMTEGGQSLASTLGHGIFFLVKAVLGCYLAVGALLLGLYFVCETYPRGATLAAFIVYLLVNFVDLIFIRSGGILGLLFRWAALVALYKGMQAGQTLYRMRVESGEYTQAA